MHDRGWTITVDGNKSGPQYGYGPQSKGVCVAFQREKGLKADGIVGPVTWSACFRTDNVT
jgi:peptidoglycan hydrolase-like protein with peptidoglycan-binding domain